LGEKSSVCNFVESAQNCLLHLVEQAFIGNFVESAQNGLLHLVEQRSFYRG
jgi:hypothetical protein